MNGTNYGGLIARLRAPRIAGMALFDWATSLFAAALIGRYVLDLGAAPAAWAAWIVVWVAFGVLVHVAIGVPTTLGYYLGINARPDAARRG